MEKSYLPILSLAYVFTVPVLVALTDRVDPKRIYLLGVTTIAVVGLGYAWLADGFWSALFFCSFWGVGWAGTYMPGLEVLSDPIEGPQQSRATAVHATSVGIRSSASFILNGGMLDVFGADTSKGWGMAFLASVGILAI